jgi:hypothetical protein
MTWLTPWAAFAVALVVVPVVARAVAGRRVARATMLLGLPAPARRPRRVPIFVVVLALAAAALAQPCLRTTTRARARTDAAAFVVLDISRSMAAAPPGGPTRLERAERVAVAARASVPGVPVGVATLTDRVLPDLFPTVDQTTFDSVVRSLGIEDPPPRETSTVATTFDALAALAGNGFFRRSETRRAVLLVTDGESRPFDAAAVRSALARARIRLVTVRVGSGADRIPGEPAYRPDPGGARISLERLGGRGSLAAALGNGPTGPAVLERRLRPLAPYLLVAALLVALAGPLAAAARGAHRLPWARPAARPRALDT